MQRLLLLLFCCSVSFLSASCQEKTKVHIHSSSETNSGLQEKKKEEPNVFSSQEKYLSGLGLVNISDLDTSIFVDLKYATTDNFTGRILYDSIRYAYLHPVAANKLVKAQKFLKEKDSTLTLVVYDAARPLSVQKKMYEVVQNTKYKAYVANPTRTGLHNYGIAVDLSICGQDSVAIDMGTTFDFFGKEAGITNEAAYLTKKQMTNRKLLREVMTKAGFFTIRGEWWHFNAMPLNEAKKNCQLIN